MKLVTVTPTTVFTGFLGSGKTTLISHLIDELQSQGQQVAYIKNEIGDEDVDAKLMQGKHIVSKELLNGCICCTLVGPFVSALDEIIDTIHPDRIIIESAGSADPASLALMVEQHPKLMRDGVIGVVDVVNFTGYQSLTPVAERQTELVDLIIFNKVELVDLAQKQKVVGYVRELNQYSPIVEAPGGKIAAELVFGIDTTQTANLIKSAAEHPQGDHHHQEHDQIQAFTYSTDLAIDEEELKGVLQELPATIFRVKGIVKLKTGEFKVLNGIYRRNELFELDQAVTALTTKIICIGYQASAIEAQVKAQLDAAFARD